MGKAALADMPVRGLSAPAAAQYIGVGLGKFFEMVGDGRMPQPLRIERRTIWDIRKLDRAFDALDEAASTAAELDTSWDDATP